MIFPQHKENKQNKIIRIFLIFALFAVIFILLRSKTIEGFFVSVFSRVNFMRTENDTKSGEILLYMAKIKALEDEIFKLNSSGANANSGVVRADIKFGGGYLFSDILLLNTGVNEGINTGDLVFTEGKIFVGKIAETGNGWSKINPIGRLGDSLILRTGLEKEIIFDATGTGRGELLAELPKETPVAVGDIVWLGENPIYPVGIVNAIQKTEGRELQNIIIVSPLPLRSVVSVVVLTNK